MIRDTQLLSRARGEYLEMPGMSLTVEQASRLWRLDRATCLAVLDQLSREGFLAQLPSGRFVARDHVASSTRRRAFDVQSH
jgi:hypothetical protein